jgi:hypothetical protein
MQAEWIPGIHHSGIEKYRGLPNSPAQRENELFEAIIPEQLAIAIRTSSGGPP